MQIKTTMKSHVAPIRMAATNNNNPESSKVGEAVGKLEHCALLVGCKMVQPL